MLACMSCFPVWNSRGKNTALQRKKKKVVGICIKESSVSGIKNSALPSVTSCHLVKVETASGVSFFINLVCQNILPRSFSYSGN